MPRSEKQSQHLILPANLLKKLYLYADGVMTVEMLIEQLVVTVLANLRTERQSLNDSHLPMGKRISTVMMAGKGMGEEPLQNVATRKACHISQALEVELVVLGEAHNLSVPEVLLALVIIGIEMIEKNTGRIGKTSGIKFSDKDMGNAVFNLRNLQ